LSPGGPFSFPFFFFRPKPPVVCGDAEPSPYSIDPFSNPSISPQIPPTLILRPCILPRKFFVFFLCVTPLSFPRSANVLFTSHTTIRLQQSLELPLLQSHFLKFCSNTSSFVFFFSQSKFPPCVTPMGPAFMGRFYLLGTPRCSRTFQQTPSPEGGGLVSDHAT